VFILKVDLCTWTKNGSKTLFPVLKRIESALPFEMVREKIAVDDSSSDNTIEILKDFNWKVYPNRRGFINGGSAEALHHVKSEFFVSVEQDVLLCPDWWDAVSKHMSSKKVAVAQGVEISTNKAESGIEKLVLKTIQRFPLSERSRLWKSVGNNIYRTKVIKKLGFVADKMAMQSFYNKVISNGFVWFTDVDAVSAHLHGDLIDAIRHTVNFHRFTQEASYLDGIGAARFLAGVAYSPINGLKLTLATREPEVQLLHIFRKLALVPVFFERKKRVGFLD
jgi:glycosyltransferase involved in cell wall biosynthesis